MEVENLPLHQNRQEPNVFKISYLGWGCDKCYELKIGCLEVVLTILERTKSSKHLEKAKQQYLKINNAAVLLRDFIFPLVVAVTDS